MKVVASIALASGFILTLMNTKFTIERLFSTSWGYTLLTGATISMKHSRIPHYMTLQKLAARITVLYWPR